MFVFIQIFLMFPHTHIIWRHRVYFMVVFRILGWSHRASSVSNRWSRHDYLWAESNRIMNNCRLPMMRIELSNEPYLQGITWDLHSFLVLYISAFITYIIVYLYYLNLLKSSVGFLNWKFMLLLIYCIS